MNLWIVFIIFAVLVAGDKIITLLNIHQVNNNFDVIDPNSIEKNPFAKWLFDKFGLINGTLIYYPLSIVTLFIGYFILSWVINERAALYIPMMLYSFVLMNNLYFFLKYSRVIS